MLLPPAIVGFRQVTRWDSRCYRNTPPYRISSPQPSHTRAGPAPGWPPPASLPPQTPSHSCPNSEAAPSLLTAFPPGAAPHPGLPRWPRRAASPRRRGCSCHGGARLLAQISRWRRETDPPPPRARAAEAAAPAGVCSPCSRGLRVRNAARPGHRWDRDTDSDRDSDISGPESGAQPQCPAPAPSTSPCPECQCPRPTPVPPTSPCPQCQCPRPMPVPMPSPSRQSRGGHIPQHKATSTLHGTSCHPGNTPRGPHSHDGSGSWGHGCAT